MGAAGADQPLVLGSVSSLSGATDDGGPGVEVEAGIVPGVRLTKGSGVLHTVQTAAPGGFSSPQCGHSVVEGMGPGVQVRYTTPEANSI